MENWKLEVAKVEAHLKEIDVQITALKEVIDDILVFLRSQGAIGEDASRNCRDCPMEKNEKQP